MGVITGSVRRNLYGRPASNLYDGDFEAQEFPCAGRRQMGGYR
jgi:hypothetical protein